MKQIHLTAIFDSSHQGKLETGPISFSLEDILRYQQSRYHGGDHTFITTTSRPLYVAENYATVRRLIEECKEHDPRFCYGVPISGGMSTHYVPKDVVSSIIAEKEGGHVTLVLSSGDRIPTGMSLIDLKKTVIEINF